MTAKLNTSKQGNASGYVVSIAIIGALFFIFGFVTWLNGSLIPFLQTACELSPFEASLVTLAFYIAYFVMALPSSFVLKHTGYKNGMSLGLLVMALGALVFIPAAYTRMFGVFLTGLFVMGTGLALLQTASNPYITIIGPRESAAARISIMGICNKLAGFISPLILTALVMQGMDVFKEENLALMDALQRDATLNQLASRLISPYAIMAVVLVLLALMIRFSPLPDTIDVEDHEDESLAGFIKQIPLSLRIPHLLLGVITIFVYVGVEVMAGDSISQFGKSLHLSYASSLTSYTMAFMVLGYILGILFIPKYLSQSNALRISAILGGLFAIGAIFSDPADTSYFSSIFGWLAFIGINIPQLPNPVFFIALLGLANALMWPAIWPLVLQDLGKFTKIASALLIMGIAGGAIIPPSYIALSTEIGYQKALWIMVPIYLFILYFATFGYKIRRKTV